LEEIEGFDEGPYDISAGEFGALDKFSNRKLASTIKLVEKVEVRIWIFHSAVSLDPFVEQRLTQFIRIYTDLRNAYVPREEIYVQK